MEYTDSLNFRLRQPLCFGAGAWQVLSEEEASMRPKAPRQFVTMAKPQNSRDALMGLQLKSMPGGGWRHMKYCIRLQHLMQL